MAAALQYSLKSGRLIPPVPHFFLKIALAIRGFLCFHANCKIICSSSVKNTISSFVRKHLTRGFLCAVLDLSGILWPLLIPEYSGIKRRGTPFLGLRNPGISHYSDNEKVIVCNSLFNRDRLTFC